MRRLREENGNIEVRWLPRGWCTSLMDRGRNARRSCKHEGKAEPRDGLVSCVGLNRWALQCKTCWQIMWAQQVRHCNAKLGSQCS